MNRKRQADVVGDRPVRRYVSLSDIEDAASQISAAELGVTVPRYLKESALALSHGEILTERRALLTRLFGVQGQLAAVGNNLNQIARGVNIDGQVQGDVQSLLDHVRIILGDIDHAVSQLSLDGDVA